MQFVILASLAGCSAGEPDLDALKAAAGSGAEFRGVAPAAYFTLKVGACRSIPASWRAALANEFAAMQAIERDVRARGVAAHLQLAVQDDARTSKAISKDCHPSLFDETRVEWAREDAAEQLGTLRKELGKLLPLPNTSAADPVRSLKFRAFVEEMIFNLEPFCVPPAGQVTYEERKRLDAELDKALRRFEGTPYQVHFAVAEADGRYRHSVTFVECAEDYLDKPPPQPSDRLAELRKDIAKAVAIAGI